MGQQTTEFVRRGKNAKATKIICKREVKPETVPEKWSSNLYTTAKAFFFLKKTI